MGGPPKQCSAGGVHSVGLGTFRKEEGDGGVEDCPCTFLHRRCHSLFGRLTSWSEGTDTSPRRASW